MAVRIVTFAAKGNEFKMYSVDLFMERICLSHPNPWQLGNNQKFVIWNALCNVLVYPADICGQNSQNILLWGERNWVTLFLTFTWRGRTFFSGALDKLGSTLNFLPVTLRTSCAVTI